MVCAKCGAESVGGARFCGECGAPLARPKLALALVRNDLAELRRLVNPEYIRPRTFVEPFALRALGAAREDQTLVKQAAARFEAMGLAWHTKQTQKLLI